MASLPTPGRPIHGTDVEADAAARDPLSTKASTGGPTKDAHGPQISRAVKIWGRSPGHLGPVQWRWPGLESAGISRASRGSGGRWGSAPPHRPAFRAIQETPLVALSGFEAKSAPAFVEALAAPNWTPTPAWFLAISPADHPPIASALTSCGRAPIQIFEQAHHRRDLGARRLRGAHAPAARKTE